MGSNRGRGGRSLKRQGGGPLGPGEALSRRLWRRRCPGPASAAGGYWGAPVQAPAPARWDKAAPPKAALPTVPARGGGGVLPRRRSAVPTRRSVLYLHCDRDTFVPEDLVSWYTERGFHFYVADLRPQDRLERQGRQRGQGPGRGECFAGLDAALRRQRDTEGIAQINAGAPGG